MPPAKRKNFEKRPQWRSHAAGTADDQQAEELAIVPLARITAAERREIFARVLWLHDYKLVFDAETEASAESVRALMVQYTSAHTSRLMRRDKRRRVTARHGLSRCAFGTALVSSSDRATACTSLSRRRQRRSCTSARVSKRPSGMLSGWPGALSSASTLWNYYARWHCAGRRRRLRYSSVQPSAQSRLTKPTRRRARARASPRKRRRGQHRLPLR